MLAEVDFNVCVTVLLQLASWVEELRQEVQNEEAVDCVEGAQRALEECQRQRDHSLHECGAAIAHGQALLQELR